MDRDAFIELLTNQVQIMVNESGDPKGFNAAAWVRDWLTQPIPALGGRRPEEIIGSDEGQREITALLARTQSGAY